MELGNKIRELRLKKTVTQEQLARQLHVSAQCVSKWETGVTMPDIQLLPELSACLGVTIDELFDLTDDTRLHRISSMLENTRMLDEAEFRSMEQFLRGKTETNPNASQYFALLSELYCHMAGGYREKAAHNAREALRLDPDDKWNHSLLRMAEDGSLLDWNFSNHTKRILYYRRFLREHPGHVRGCLCLWMSFWPTIFSKRRKSCSRRWAIGWATCAPPPTQDESCGSRESMRTRARPGMRCAGVIPMTGWRTPAPRTASRTPGAFPRR